jgi:hypothetical protein
MRLPPKLGIARVTRATIGMIDSVGLRKTGALAFAAGNLPALAKLAAAVFAHVFGYRADGYAEAVRVLEDRAGLAGRELNGIYSSSDLALPAAGPAYCASARLT